jgi:DGQHR domain-containing protein
MSRNATIHVDALRVVQDRKHPLFMFVLTADQLAAVADVRRVGRGDDGELDGYQRGEVKKHVAAITDYLNSSRGFVLFPHSLILALTHPVSFAPAGSNGETTSTVGRLTIPIRSAGGSKPALLVDGQQRSLALAKARRRDFPVPICAFQATDLATQREQFLRVNSTHPLPRGLIAELIPHVRSVLPPKLALRQAPAALCEELNRDTRSPFRGLIRRPSYATAERRRAVVSDTALIGVLEESFANPAGALFPYRNVATGQVDIHGAKEVLIAYWNAVRATFPEAWGLPPRESRLMHSAGLRAMGKLMDRAMATARLDDPRLEQRLRRELGRLKPVCRWTDGSWDSVDGLDWNEVQNVPSHVRMLTDYLQRVYLAA